MQTEREKRKGVMAAPVHQIMLKGAEKVLRCWDGAEKVLRCRDGAGMVPRCWGFYFIPTQFSPLMGYPSGIEKKFVSSFY